MFEVSKSILKETTSEKDFSFLVFALSICLLPLSINLSTFTFIASVVLKLIQVALKRNALFESKALKNAAIIGLIFFVYIEINSILQSGLSNHIEHFEKLYMHFALFFITPILLRTKRKNKLLLYALFLGLIIAVVYVFIYVVIHSMTFDKYAFTTILDIHHTYLSMFILTFVNYSIVQVITNKDIKNTALKAIFVLLGVISLAVMYLLDSKVGMLIFLLLFIVHSLPELSKKNRWHYVSFLFLILLVLSAFTNKVNVNYLRALDFRLEIWEVSFKEFEDNLVFGNLKLPEKDIINYNHYLNGKYYYLDSDLNSHNQYLSILMRFGFVGFIILFFYGINVFKKVNPKTQRIDLREFFGFLIISLTVCYIENILDRHHGIVYLTIFYNYYLVAIENAET